jgi:hypothetical protein
MIKANYINHIPSEAMEYAKYDRKTMQRVMAGCLGLLVTAVKVKLAYLKLTNRLGAYHMEKGEWEKNIKAVLKKIKSVDEEVTDAWQYQKRLDLKDLSAQYKNDNNQMFANRLYEFYSKKYYWRDWVVIVYNKMAKSWTGKNGHVFKLCGGDEYLEKDGRNVITSSVPKEKAKINVGHYVDKLGSVKTDTIFKVFGMKTHTAWTAQSVMDQMTKFTSTPDVCMQAVISDREDPQVGHAPGRIAYKWKYFYNMYIFG